MAEIIEKYCIAVPNKGIYSFKGMFLNYRYIIAQLYDKDHNLIHVFTDTYHLEMCAP